MSLYEDLCDILERMKVATTEIESSALLLEALQAVARYSRDQGVQDTIEAIIKEYSGGELGIE